MYEYCINIVEVEECIFLKKIKKVIDELQAFYSESDITIENEWVSVKTVSEELIPKTYKNKVLYPLFFILTVIFHFTYFLKSTILQFFNQT